MDTLMEIYAEADADSNGLLNESELENFIHEVTETMFEDHDEEGKAFIALHIEAEGDYGIALPAGVDLHVLMGDGHDEHDHGDHDDHDDHGDGAHDEDDHDDHDGEEGDHDDHDDHDDHGDEDALAYDPHSWLDPSAYAVQLDIVVETLSTAFPSHADAFKANADAYKVELQAIHEGFEDAFGDNGTCTNNIVAANHNAYSYLTVAYGVEFVTVHGLDPEGTPSLDDIAEVVDRIEEDGITVLFVEEYTDASAVSSLVEQTVTEDMPDGVMVLTLYTMEMAPMDTSDNYVSLMNKNLENLKTGLGC